MAGLLNPDLGTIQTSGNFSTANNTLDLANTVTPTIVNAGTLQVGGTSFTGVVRGGHITPTAGQVTATAATIATGLGTIVAHIEEVLASGSLGAVSANVTTAGGNLIIGNNGTSYTMATTDLIEWIAIGST